MQLANVTARLLASLKGHRDQENLSEWKKANNTITFKKARKIWGTAGCSAPASVPRSFTESAIMEGVPGTRNTLMGDGEQPVNANSPRAHSA